MPGFASIESAEASLARTPAFFGVYRYRPTGAPKYQLLPNIRVLSIQQREGPDTGSARFRYVFNPADPTTDPTSFQQALSINSTLVNVVQNDERIVVMRFDPDGSNVPIFDGFAQVPELTFSPSQELVTFLANGVAVREWDTPIAGALMRDADLPGSVQDIETDLPTFFNPDGEPNATPANADALDPAGNAYPTFLDALVIRSPDLRRKWSLPMAVRYLCYRHNPDEAYVANPDGSLIDSLLDSRSPISGVTMDPSDPSTYVSNPIIVADFPATGKPWPVALHELLEPNGFGMVFRVEPDVYGDPHTRLDIFRRQDGTASSYKDLYLQPAGNPLDPSATNLGKARLARNTVGVANIFTVRTKPVRYEASFVLAPGFPILTSDAADATALKAFDRSNPSFSTSNREKYRFYVFDETGEGHWDFSRSAMSRTVASLDSLLGGPNSRPDQYVRRRRIPAGELLSLDPSFRPLRPRLAISTDYTGTSPGLWDGTGTWQSVIGGFELLQDRLGIWVNVSNPNGWNIGVSTVSGMPYPSGVVRGIEDQANTGAKHFFLRVTCVIEGDHSLDAKAGQRPSSATSFAIERSIDGSDRYFKKVVSAQSEFNSTGSAIVTQDDTDEATAEAEAFRLAGEAGEVAGSTTIPRYSSAYLIGDRIRSIQGRNLSLQTNAGAPSEEGEIFPAVVAVTWELERMQQTILQLSDHRGELK